MQYNNKLMTYETELEAMELLNLKNRFELMQLFKTFGFYLQWQDKYNGKGKKIYIPIKSRK